MAFKAGKTDDFEGSMAAAIEKAFERAWSEVKDDELPKEGRADRRILFVAMAQGVLKYLRNHAEDGFEVGEVVQKSDNNIISSKTINVSGVGDIDVTVTQDSGGDNRVKSKIKSTDGEILVNVEGLYS
jgi:hypothetical protein